MSSTLENDSKTVETAPRGGMPGALQSSLRTIQRRLGIRVPERRPSPPPSYEAVLLQKNSECDLRNGLIGVSSFLGKLDARLPPMTARRSEMGVEKHLTALFATGTSATPEGARRHPIAVWERVRGFLSYCIARDSDLDHLLPLSQSDREYFRLLDTVYHWSWMHQIVYGWDKTPHEVHAQAYEVFALFVENPIRKSGLPLHFFLHHLKVFKNVQELPQGSSLLGGPSGTQICTLQAVRSRGELGKLKELLRMNYLVLNAVVDRVSPVYATLKRKMEVEYQKYDTPDFPRNGWRFFYHDSPVGLEFLRINSDRHSTFPPVRRREDEEDTRWMEEMAQSPDVQQIRHDLEFNAWACD